MARNVEIHALQVDASHYSASLVENDHLDVFIKSGHEHFRKELNVEYWRRHLESSFLHRVAEIHRETSTLDEVFRDVDSELWTVDHAAIVLYREQVF